MNVQFRPPSTKLEIIVFVFFATLAIVGALSTVLARNPIRAAVGLFVHIVALAALYLNLGAHFLGVIQLLVYAGAVVVLFVFVIMLLGPAANSPRDGRGVVGRGLAIVMMVIVGGFVVDTVRSVQRFMPERTDAYGTMTAVGSYLFQRGVIPFEMIGITLTIAVIGAFAIARGKHYRRAFADPDPTDPEKLAETTASTVPTAKATSSDAAGGAH